MLDPAAHVRSRCRVPECRRYHLREVLQSSLKLLQPILGGKGEAQVATLHTRPEETVGGERPDHRLLRTKDTVVELQDEVHRPSLEVVELIQIRPQVAIEMDPPSPHDRLRQSEPIGDDGVDVQIDRPIEVMLLEQKVHLSRRPQ